MTNKRGILRDIALATVSALVAVLLFAYFSPRTVPERDDALIESAAKAEKLPNDIVDQVLTELNDLKMEMQSEHIRLYELIADLEGANYSEFAHVNSENQSIEDLADKIRSRLEKGDRSVFEAGDELPDYRASKSYQDEIDSQLKSLDLNSVLVDDVTCYSTKCFMEFEHTTGVDQQIFQDNVLLSSKGLFTGKFTFKNEPGENGKIYTKVQIERP